MTLSLADVALVPVTREMTKGDADRLVGRTVPDVPAYLPGGDGPALFVDGDTAEPVLAYLPLVDAAVLRRAILSAPMTTTYRSSGITNVSRTFGMAPRKPIQWREGCAPTSLARDEPAVMRTLEDFALALTAQLGALLPQELDRGKDQIAQVLPEWRLAEDAIWTSGVINRTSALPYHRDRFNFDSWSAMPVLRRGVRGGFLHLPEYGLCVPCRDGWVLYMSGYRLLHGVTPLTLSDKDGYRYSIVYYALKGMKDCFTAAVETKYAQERRTSREHTV